MQCPTTTVAPLNQHGLPSQHPPFKGRRRGGTRARAEDLPKSCRTFAVGAGQQHHPERQAWTPSVQKFIGNAYRRMQRRTIVGTCCRPIRYKLSCRIPMENPSEAPKSHHEIWKSFRRKRGCSGEVVVVCYSKLHTHMHQMHPWDTQKV